MNIQHFWPAEAPAFPTPADWKHLLELRKATFSGFNQIEEKNGHFPRNLSLSSALGQELMRIFCFRVLEEASEAVMSNEEAHHKEEVIDSLNYLLSTLFFDEVATPFDRAIDELQNTSYEVHELSSRYLNSPLNLEDLGNLTLWLGGDLSDTFRNRSWMYHSQDLYFSGTQVYFRVFSSIVRRYLRVFRDWPEFWRYYVAKDAVLQFRLSSRY